MKQIALNSEGDLDLYQNDLRMIDGTEDIRQSLFILFSTNLNEWFLNPDFGTDFSLFMEKPTDEQIRAEVVRVIGEEPRVSVIENVEVEQDRKARMLHVHFRVTTTEGETIEQEVTLNGS